MDWDSLLQGKTDGSKWPFKGVRVGDDMTALMLDQVRLIEPMTPNVRRGQSSSLGICDIAEDGLWSPVPRDQLVNELRQYGGRVFAEQASYLISDGKIRKLWIRGAPLSGLPFKREKDIEQVLGPALGSELSFGTVAYHYPRRHLSVCWDTKEDRIEYVAVGSVDWVPPVFSANDVLVEYLAGMTAGIGPEWVEPPETGSSEWIRYKRLRALLDAFGLGDPISFSEAEFLEGKTLDSFPKCCEAIRETMGNRISHDSGATLSSLFGMLLSYRIQAEELLHFNFGWLEVSSQDILTAIRITEHANKDLTVALSSIEALLIEMIDRDGRQFSKKEMIAQWDWPQVDLNFLVQTELWGGW